MALGAYYEADYRHSEVYGEAHSTNSPDYASSTPTSRWYSTSSETSYYKSSSTYTPSTSTYTPSTSTYTSSTYTPSTEIYYPPTPPVPHPGPNPTCGAVNHITVTVTQRVYPTGYPPLPPGSYCPDGPLPLCKAPPPTTCPDGTAPPCKAPPATCPAGCAVHSNHCDATTAPTCIFPDPRVPNPRAACACRPGYKASAPVADTDTARQWRLDIPGQEHRVWVAEGVACDQLCVVSTGVDSCREVTALPAACAGY
ncbi:hypothetical protein B0T26DRAFT_751565 [Lasiosphaeria miniovina]|uniref:Uncharacterized protein n=1 Tax=Lasiosphaeria miniovina TaxID=1954250 RepID=A0AA40AKH8_9PEZI|nr:uncharacterized protein B0T26DRAFT_751565 [Lasiosphaeria miniovina]KAK0717521.1 hypothetical protein B0T26DRAFT_751565 [Lasiosphaeria miniovina]